MEKYFQVPHECRLFPPVIKVLLQDVVNFAEELDLYET